MATIRGVCEACGKEDVALPARKMCWKCYRELCPPEERHKVKKYTRVSKNKPTAGYPKPVVITVWECSDGREFGSEKEALWYQLSLERK